MPFSMLLRTRTILSLLVVVCFTAILGGTWICFDGVTTMRSSEREQRVQGMLLLDQSHRLKNAMDREVAGLRGFLITGGEQYVTHWDQGISDFTRAVAELRALESDPRQIRRLDEIAEVNATFTTNARRMMTLKRSGRTAESLEANVNLGNSLFTRMSALVDSLIATRKAEAARIHARDEGAAHSLAWKLLLLGLFTLPAILALAFLAARRISLPLKDFQQAAHAIAQGDLDTRIPRRVDDEFGRVAEAFNDMAAQVTQRTAQLMEQKHFNELILNSAGEGLLGIDAEGLITFVNPMASRLTGYTPQELIGRSVHDVLHHSRRDGTRLPERDCPIHNSIRRGAVLHAANEQFWHQDGTSFPVEYVSTPIHEGDRVVGAVITFTDITERLAAEAMIEQMAYHDALTGLPNRLLAHDRLNQALAHARRDRRHAAVMLMDLDRFKLINETLGHPIGDQVLKTIAERLLYRLREVDTVARLGGDEFALVLPDLSTTSDIAKIAKVIHEEVSRVIRIGEHDLYVTPSMGISVYPSDGDDAVTLIKNAESALYQAKEDRNRYQLYAPAMNASASEWLLLESHLRRALERNELVLHYQPQIDLRTGTIVGAEALIRWMHPEWGMVSPAKFIPLAEATGLIVPISEWVLRTACAQNVAWQQMGLHSFRVAVNLSGRHLKRHTELVRMVAKTLEETGLAPESLEIELTESILMEDVEASLETLARLSAMGVTLSIDDFGTGYSSLSYLKRFPIDTLKIDQAFVRDSATDEEDAAIVMAVIALAHSLRLSVIAEGVETEQQLSFLKDQGCDEVQGYFFSRPLPADDLATFVRNHEPQALVGQEAG
jgi:diguanylate cyclase (GGDEF)-like protein/PAS domain S-box-containing protein